MLPIVGLVVNRECSDNRAGGASHSSGSSSEFQNRIPRVTNREEQMITITGRTALVTGSSRGIGRGIAFKLAECGVNRIGVHYLKNRAAADDTADKLRELGAEPLLVQADVTKVDDIARMFATVREGFGGLDTFVSNARPDIEHFYQPVMDIPLENWQIAFDSQARALLVAAPGALEPMPGGGGNI